MSYFSKSIISWIILALETRAKDIFSLLRPEILFSYPLKMKEHIKSNLAGGWLSQQHVVNVPGIECN